MYYDKFADGPSPNASNVSVTAGSVVTRVSPPNRVSTYVQLGRPTEGSRYLVEIRGGQVWVSVFLLIVFYLFREYNYLSNLSGIFE